jgi:hypothetical protein
MTSTEANSADLALANQVAEEYRSRGYAVKVEPAGDDLPFDLGSYRPDLVAVRGNDKLLIEVKSSVRRKPLDNLVDAANHVRAHPEWRLLLVTADDTLRELPDGEERDLPSWSQFRTALGRTYGYAVAGAEWGRALMIWSLIEGMLRRRSLDEKLPLDRLPTTALIREMYSRGELSVSQYEGLTAALPIRNELAHGFVSARAHGADLALHVIARALLEEWDTEATRAGR